MSCKEKSVPLFTKSVELKWYTVLHHGSASGTHSETCASEPRGDSGYTLAKYLLVSVFMILSSIPVVDNDVVVKCPKLHLNTRIELGNNMIFLISVLKLVRIGMLAKIGQRCPWVSHFGFLCTRQVSENHCSSVSG